MPHQWALFYFAQSAKNVTDPKRRASVASDLETCSSSSYRVFESKGKLAIVNPQRRIGCAALMPECLFRLGHHQ